MKIVSVNRGEKRLVKWKNAEVETGIFKFPVAEAIMLGKTDVEDDAVVDRKYHGGFDKAVYAYSADHYPYWKNQFPDLEWSRGMFGENLTVGGLDESKMKIGTRYQLGEAEIEVCQPRQPCFKLGIRFNTQSILKTFVQSSFCGVYFRVLKEGKVDVGDEFQPLNEPEGSPTVAEVYALMYHKQIKSNELTLKALNCESLPEGIRAMIVETQT